MPRDDEYRWLRGRRAASTSFSTTASLDGMSGLPKPRSITSSPARRSSIFSASIWANAYGGRLPMRRNSIPTGYSTGGGCGLVDRTRCLAGHHVEDEEELRHPAEHRHRHPELED